MIRLVIFDLDGTLLNTIDDLAVCTNYVLHQHHFPVHNLQAYRFFVGNGITKLIERALPENARQEKIIFTLKEEFIKYYQQHKTDLTHPYPGIPELLEELRTQHILLTVASNKYHDGTVELIHHYFGKNRFEIISGQKENIPVKPDPTIVYNILKQTGIPASESLYVGDSGVDMQTARNSGLLSIGVTYGFRPRQELEDNGACYLAEQPSDILKIIQSHQN